MFYCSGFLSPTLSILGVKGTGLSCFRQMSRDPKCKQRLSGALRIDLTNREQNFEYRSLQSPTFFIALLSFLQHWPFCGLKGTEVSCLREIRLNPECKQRLSGALRIDLTNREENVRYQSLRKPKFFVVLASFLQR